MIERNYQCVDKVWGREYWIKNWQHYCMKILELNKMYKCSIHQHYEKIETFYVHKGNVVVEIDYNYHLLGPCESITVKPTELHSFFTIDEQAVLIEVSTEHFETDSYRIDKSHKMTELEYINCYSRAYFNKYKKEWRK